MVLTGTALNIATVVLGGTTGTLVGARLPARYHEIVLQALGLGTLAIGTQMAAQTRNPLFMLGGILIGALIGERLNIDAALQRLGMLAQQQATRLFAPTTGADDAHESSADPGTAPAAIKSRLATFSEAFVTSSLVFCVGPMTILGSIQDGLYGKIDILSIKSLLDGFASFAFGASLGPGVLASTVTIAVYQGGLSVGASYFHGLITPAMSSEMTAVGGLMVLAVGLKLLNIASVRIGNLLPGLIVAPSLVALVNAVAPLIHR